jgi:ribosomal protein L14
MFIKGSAKVVEPPQIVYKGVKFKYSIKGDIVRCIIIRTFRTSRNASGFNIKFDANSTLTIKKKQTIKSKYVKGIVSKFSLKRKKFITLFTKVF